MNDNSGPISTKGGHVHSVGQSQKRLQYCFSMNINALYVSTLLSQHILEYYIRLVVWAVYQILLENEIRISD